MADIIIVILELLGDLYQRFSSIALHVKYFFLNVFKLWNCLKNNLKAFFKQVLLTPLLTQRFSDKR